VGPELSAAPHAAACPACGAALRPEAQWCSLCYHDLRPAPAPAPEPPTPVYGGLDPLTAPLLDLVLPPVPPAVEQVAEQVVEGAAPTAPAPRASAEQAPLTWPCTRCGAPNAIDSPVCGTCGSAFLAAAKEKVSLVVPGIGDLAHLSRGQRLGVAAAVLAAVLVPLALITFLMTPAPSTSKSGTTETTVTTVNP
jgi:ribosomal protein L40E